MVGGMTAQTAVLDRIAGLPVKVAVPLRELVRSELMSERTAETLLEAGELTGQPQHLLGFAAALDELRRRGVPIEDAVRMARQQGRRISLRWSPKRWRAEHDKMSRMATLDRLTAANAAYDLSEYERHLPERWPGYLIRTSRRLGMEGLRQGHCVASYHDIVTAGRQAIAAVFVDRKRWTVALVRTGAEDAPLRITQIRGPYNRSPAASDTAAIHERLGIEPPRRRAATAQPPRTGAYLENLRRALPALREHGITYVYVAFSGEGDSGQIDDVYFTPSPPPGERYEFTVPCEAARHFREDIRRSVAHRARDRGHADRRGHPRAHGRVPRGIRRGLVQQRRRPGAPGDRRRGREGGTRDRHELHGTDDAGLPHGRHRHRRYHRRRLRVSGTRPAALRCRREFDRQEPFGAPVPFRRQACRKARLLTRVRGTRRTRRPTGRVPAANARPARSGTFTVWRYDAMPFRENLPPGTPSAFGLTRPCGAAVCLRAGTTQETHYVQRLRVVPVTAATALRARLADWPAKVAVPLRDLLERELLRPATAEAVFDAAELAGEPQHVLGFTIAMLEMSRDGVPMLDTIRMAKQIGAPVNLRWSRKRWQVEHARLSRRVTLEQLSADDAVYDLASFEALLPDRWPGYLIRTSRRLGLEGLRQDHCVAAYNRRIVDGQCAIATMLLDDKRWTVELRRYGNDTGAELCVAQIAGRYNAPPSRQVRSAILKALGIRQDYHFPTYGNHPEEHAYMDNLRTLLPVLREHGVERGPCRLFRLRGLWPDRRRLLRAGECPASDRLRRSGKPDGAVCA